jgi:hypothetical protein
MKVYISQRPPSDDSYVAINDLGVLDILVEDSEATEIIVDNFLTKFPFSEIGGVVQKLASKLRSKGKMVFYQAEIDMICYQRSRSMVDVDRLNEILFAQGEIRSVFPVENLVDLLRSFGLTICSKELHDTCQALIVATR